MYPDLSLPAAEPGLPMCKRDADADPNPDRDLDALHIRFPRASAAEPRPSTSKIGDDPDAAVNLDCGPWNPSLLVLPKGLLIRGMRSGHPSSAANPILSTRKRAALREAYADADLDRKSRTEIEADLMTQTPPRSKRMRILMEGEEEHRATGSWGSAASGKRVVRPSSSWDVCEPTPKRRKVTSGNLHGDWKLVLPEPDGEGSHVCWRPISSSDHTDADNERRAGLDCAAQKRKEKLAQPKLQGQSKEHDNDKDHIFYYLDDGKERHSAENSFKERCLGPDHPYCQDADDGFKERDDYSASRKRMKDHQAKSTIQSKEHGNDKKRSYTPDHKTDHCDADDSSKERRGDLSASNQRKRMCWGNSTRQSRRHDVNKKRESYTPDDRSGSCDADNGSKEQLFVNVGSFHVSLQSDLNQTTINTLVHCAFKRVGISTKDFYCTFAGKCLHNERLLSSYSLHRDSTIKVQHRLRGGRLQMIDYINWNEAILGVPRFVVFNLPHQLRDMTQNIVSAMFLSGRIQDLASAVLAALCRIFLRNRSLNGNFNSTHILFHEYYCIFDDSVPELPFTPIRARNDLARIHGIFEPVLQSANPQDIVLYVDHLLGFLNACPAGVDLRSQSVVTFLTHHLALLTYSERIAISHLLRSMIERLVGAAAVRFRDDIGGVPDLGPAWNVPSLRRVLTHNAIRDPITQQILQVTYSLNGKSFVRLSSNFFKHGSLNIPVHFLEAAFSAVMAQDDFMANLLQRIATLDHPLPNPPFDVVELFGKRVRV